MVILLVTYNLNKTIHKILKLSIAFFYHYDIINVIDNNII